MGGNLGSGGYRYRGMDLWRYREKLGVMVMDGAEMIRLMNGSWSELNKGYKGSW